MTVKVLFVCLGNICRSPTAEGVFRAQLEESGMAKRIEVDSAGTAGWHQGRAPDPRTIEAAKKRGFDLSQLRARQVKKSDFDEYDYILAMDEDNLQDLKAICPTHFTGRLQLFLDYSAQKKYREVPDPYHGGESGFELVLDLIEGAAQGLLRAIQSSENRI